MGKEYEDIKEEFWKPETKGNAVNGILMIAKKGVGENKAMLYSLRKEGGGVIHIWGSTVLDEKMVTIQQGDDIRIIYEGKVEPEGKGKAYHNYKIQKIRSEEDSD